MDIATTAWVAAVAALTGFGAVIFWLVRADSRGRTCLVRCPGTGSATLVRVAPAGGGEAKSGGFVVRECKAWPEKKDCAQGCLARYPETRLRW